MAANKKGVKKKEHEKLDDATIERVIGLLEGEKPITKKEACEALNIRYNTTRLKNIIEEYQEKAARRKKNFEKTKNTSFTRRVASSKFKALKHFFNNKFNTQKQIKCVFDAFSKAQCVYFALNKFVNIYKLKKSHF